MNVTQFIALVKDADLNSDTVVCLHHSLVGKDGNGGTVYRTGKWAVTKDIYAADRFPPACVGTAFAIEFEQVYKILRIRYARPSKRGAFYPSVLK